MTRVDFYILQDVDLNAACRFACRLAVKAMSAGMPVHLHVTNEPAADDLDELLWSYPEHRFVPHARADRAEAASREPVMIGWEPPRQPDGLLVNLSDHVPTFFGRFDRVAEVVVDANRSTGRDRFRFYRDRGYPLFDHHIDEWETA